MVDNSDNTPSLKDFVTGVQETYLWFTKFSASLSTPTLGSSGDLLGGIYNFGMKG